MSGRRRHARFAVVQPWEGTLRVLREVTVVEDTDLRGLLVFSHAFGVPGEVVALELAGAGTLARLIVCVTESRPVVVDGVVRHSLRLTVLDEERRVERMAGVAMADRRPAGLAEVMAADDLVGVLVRDVPVHVRNVSGSGCLMESAAAIEYGTVATLRMQAGAGESEEFTDAVRVSRCDRIEGGGTRWLVGVEFLWATAPAPDSLRRAARRLQHRAGRVVMHEGFESATVM